MKKGTLLTCMFGIALLIVSSVVAGGPPFGAFWADGMVYQTVIAPNSLPNKGPKDGLYVFEGLDGQNPVAEAKPGDRDYNGGRWQVYVLQFTPDGLAVHDADNDGAADFQLMSWEMVNHHISLGHLEQVAMGPSFVCPLIK